MQALTFRIRSFEELSNEEMYAMLRLRINVFVVEQNCPYPDLDNKDQRSFHLLAYAGDKLAAYARCLPKGISYPDASAIGRVVIDPEFRSNKWGYQLMKKAISLCYEKFGKGKITISAQHHLQRFYEKCGFTAVGDVYPEDDIPHIKMIMN